jgi:hypothetical protein
MVDRDEVQEAVHSPKAAAVTGTIILQDSARG